MAVLFLVLLEAILCSLAWSLSRGSTERAALLLLIISAPLELYRTPILGVNVSLFRLSLGVVLLGFLTGAVKRSSRQFARDRILLVYIALLGVMAISLVLTSENTSLGLRLFSQVGIGIVTAVLVAHLATAVSAVSVAWLWVIGACLPVLAGIWQGVAIDLGAQPDLPFLDILPVASGLDITRETIFFGNEVRLRGTFGDPNHFAVYLLLSLGMVGALVDHYRREKSSPMVVTVALLCAAGVGALIATYSRSAWVAGIIVALGTIVFLRRPIANAGIKALLPLAAILGLCIAVAVPAAPAITGRLDKHEKSNLMSNESHAHTMKVAWRDLHTHPVTGIGVSDFGRQLHEGSRTSGAHSSYLTVAAELGLPGLILLVTGLSLTLARLARSVSVFPRSVHRWLLVGMLLTYVGFASASLFYDLWWDDFHWVFLGLVLGLTLAPQPSKRGGFFRVS
jgi:O-Antigen ligase